MIALMRYNFTKMKRPGITHLITFIAVCIAFTTVLVKAAPLSDADKQFLARYEKFAARLPPMISAPPGRPQAILEMKARSWRKAVRSRMRAPPSRNSAIRRNSWPPASPASTSSIARCCRRTGSRPARRSRIRITARRWRPAEKLRSKRSLEKTDLDYILKKGYR